MEVQVLSSAPQKRKLDFAGTRIGLDIVIREFRDGRSPEQIFDAYPSIGSLSRVYGAITFILEHHDRWEAFKAGNPLPPDMIDRFERARRDLSVKQS